MSPTAPPAAAPDLKVPKDACYQPPAIAWPTLGLMVGALGLWLTALDGALSGWLHPALAVALQSLAAFLQFAVLHDGVHRALMRGFPALNDAVASVAGSFLGPGVSVAAFRHVHFAHHRHTGDPLRDPDRWSGMGPNWRLPMQWATADLAYAATIAREWLLISRSARMQIILITAAMVSGYALSWVCGFGMEATLYWLLPSRIAVLGLAFAFNFLPHRPHDRPHARHPDGAGDARRGGKPVTPWLFVYEMHHAIHHRFPRLPFYRHQAIWLARRAAFRTPGTPDAFTPARR